MTSFSTSPSTTTTTTTTTKSICVLALSVVLVIAILTGILAMSGHDGAIPLNTDTEEGTVSTTVHDPETCPFLDTFRFQMDVQWSFPPGFDPLVSCTNQELETISSTFQTAANGAQFDPQLHISDFAVSSTCDTAHDNRQLGLFVSISHYFVVQEGRCMFCGNGGVDGNSRMLRANDLGTTVQRRTTANGDLCGCHTVAFPNVVTPNTDSTNEFLLSNGMSILAEDTNDTITMDFVRPILLHGITASDDAVFSIRYVNGNTVTLNSNDPIDALAANSVTVLNGAIDKMEYCYEACPEAKSRFEDETADIEAELNELLDVAFEAAAVPCLESIDVNAEVKLTSIPIDQPVEC